MASKDLAVEHAISELENRNAPQTTPNRHFIRSVWDEYEQYRVGCKGQFDPFEFMAELRMNEARRRNQFEELLFDLERKFR